jgi:fibronectin-binding autotransporter adhesin
LSNRAGQQVIFEENAMITTTKCATLTMAILFAALSLLTLPGSAAAGNSVWIQPGSGLWSSTANWTDTTGDMVGDPADGAGFLADFSIAPAGTITAAATVSLDTPRTIGQLKFNNGAGGSWTLDNNGSATNILTLDNTGSPGQPSINVVGGTTTISTVLAGTNGLIATGGNSTLVLSGANSYSGLTTVNSTSGTGNQFTLVLANNSALGSSTLVLNSGG